MTKEPLKILTLDGGGSKGIFSLGILYEMEAKLAVPLHEYFDCFYGTSTGAIIASSLALGDTIQNIKSLYLNEVPRIMGKYTAGQRTKELKVVLNEQYGEKKFADCKKYLGVVSASLDEKRPKIFKSSVEGAHGRKATFEPGFGFTIADAVASSCAALPFFTESKLRSKDGAYNFNLIDGGFSANNPTLFSLIDALKAFSKSEEDIVIINVGTGVFPHRTTMQLFVSGCVHLLSRHFISDIMEINANTTGIVTEMLFNNVKVLRINETFTQPELKTNFLEDNVQKLEKLFGQGRTTFGRFEKEFVNMIGR